MWFEDGEGASPRARRKRNQRQRKPVLMVTTQVTKRHAERTLRVGTIVVVVVALVGLVGLTVVGVTRAEDVLFSRNPQYTIRNLDIKCSGGIVTPELVRQQLKQMDVMPGTNLFAFSIREVQETWLRDAPYVKSMDIYRRLPDTLEVRIAERVPIARLGKWRHRYLVVDDEGCIFFARNRRSRQLPEIEGYPESRLGPGSRARGGIMDAVNAVTACARAHVEHVVQLAEIDVGKPEAVRLELAGGEECVIRWQNPEDLEGRLKHLSAVLRRAAKDGRSVRSVNLTLDSYRSNCPVTYR